ncbi:DUF899 family protein [Candidatus Poribacteria bacterium]|nr:DUF899 family protein [Candidatus Poribacteria bacterium]
MTVDDKSLKNKITRLENELFEKQKEIIELKSQLKPQLVQNYMFLTVGEKEINLSEMFGNKSDLIVVHNMGVSCPYCTMWADGFNGLLQHLENRAGFAVVSPDAPDIQYEFAQERGWRFTMYSSVRSTFSNDFGFKNEDGWLPGVSTFHRNSDGAIFNVQNAYFGPGDLFCSVWHLFDLLDSGTEEWHPMLNY